MYTEVTYSEHTKSKVKAKPRKKSTKRPPPTAMPSTGATAIPQQQNWVDGATELMMLAMMIIFIGGFGGLMVTLLYKLMVTPGFCG